MTTSEKYKIKTKGKAGEWSFQIINYAVFAIFAIICVYPFYYLIINSISANDLSANGMVNWLPKQMHLGNYKEVLKLSGLGMALFVSVARTVLGTACTVLASAYLGFMFTQQKMWHRKLWYRLIVITMYFNAGLIPMFMTMKTLHLTNNFLVYIIPAIVQPFNIIIVKTYVESIPASLQEAAEIDGAVPSEISNQPATEPCEAMEPTNAPSIRWDIYGEVGYPKMDTMEDLLDVMEQMQAAAEQSDSGKAVYAFSLFKDWDGDVMQNASALCALYGYEPMGFVMAKVDGSESQSVIDSEGIYVQSLRLLYEANQRGLVDPESTTQNFDTLQTKYRDGGVLYSLWPWLGAGQYNTSENTAAGKGFASAIIGDMQCLSYGSMPLGKMEVGMMVGSQTKDPQRVVDFIDWLYSPEGIEAACPQTGGGCGPEGLTWEMKDGEPVLTEFGVKAFVDIDPDLQVPDEWGGGTWKDGVSALNVKTVGVVDCDESTGMCYNYQRWADYQKRTATALQEDWSAHNDGALSSIEYMKDKNLLMVLPVPIMQHRSTPLTSAPSRSSANRSS